MTGKLLYLKLKLSEIKHRYCYEKQYDKMEIAMKKFRNCPKELMKDRDQIKREIKMLKNYWKCYPTHYFRYELYKKENSFSNEILLDYIPEFFFYNIFLPQYEDSKYSFLIGEKNLTDLFFKSLNINCPEILGKVINGQIFDREMNTVDKNIFLENIFKLNIRKIFFKPVDGQGGYGIDIFSKKNDEYIAKNGKILNINYLESLSKDYIIQESLVQSDEINEIYSESINTFRIATENINGDVRIISSVLRIGRDGSELDNCCQGGMSLGINSQTGEMYGYAITELGELFTRHPNSKYMFKGNKIKEWDTIKNFTLESHKKIPYFTYLGWDIVLKEDKTALAIETNLGFGIDLFQIPLGGLRQQFNIENPEKYWKSRCGLK